MAGGLVYTPGAVKLKQYEGHMTLYVIVACLVAASGGLIFGYDLGISGGVTSMDDFLKEFFLTVYEKEKTKESDNYCKYSSQTLQLFTSSLYLAGAVASFVASYVTRYHGRRQTIFIGGLNFLLGSILNGAAQNIEMLILGRILLGIGIGFANQAVPLYLSEMAQPKARGFLNIMFQSATTVGILAANLINYGTGKLASNGWRISLGVAAVPAVFLTLGAIFLPDTPNSLLERGHPEQGRKVLQKIRGVTNVDAEFEDLVAASEISKAVKSPWRNLLKRDYRPQLVMALVIPACQQLGGNNAITFYAPVLFKTVGFGSNAALFSTVILGSVKVVSTWISMLIVDKWGRKILFFEGGIQMAVCQIAMGVILKVKMGSHNTLDDHLAILMVVLMCAFVSAFDWSWGPLGWLVPSEIYPLQIRSAAQSVTVSVNFLFTFFIGQIFLTLFCHLKAGTFFFFTGWLILMTVFVALFLPETKNVPLEEMEFVWRNHWFWRRYARPDAKEDSFVVKENSQAPKDSELGALAEDMHVSPTGDMH